MPIDSINIPLKKAKNTEMIPNRPPSTYVNQTEMPFPTSSIKMNEKLNNPEYSGRIDFNATKKALDISASGFTPI